MASEPDEQRKWYSIDIVPPLAGHWDGTGTILLVLGSLVTGLGIAYHDAIPIGTALMGLAFLRADKVEEEEDAAQ